MIVVPDGLPDVPAYVATLGLAGDWKDAPELPGLGYRYHEGDFYPHWRQIAGADTGPDDAASGYPTGFEVWRDGAVWVSRINFNVSEPLADGTPTTWSRKDGTFVTPAGWQYQPGEDVQEGGVWYRVDQATSFAPSTSPSQYVEIDGPGGDPVVPATAEWAEGVIYSVGDEVTFDGADYRCVQAHTSVAGWTPVAVPALWEVIQ